MDVCRLSLLVFIIGDICLHAFGKALKSCRSHSSRCHPITPLSTTSTTTTTDFTCPTKGHFLVPHDVFSFYKCGGPEHQPCLCACKNQQMCFDATRRRCRFAFLDSVRNCSQNAEVEGRRQSVSGLQDTKLAGNSRGKSHKDSRVVNEILKDKLTTPILPIGGVSVGDRAGGSGVPVTDRPPTDSEAPAARHAGQKRTPDIIEDTSLFPAWAISLLVLCVVIALVLVVMVLY